MVSHQIEAVVDLFVIKITFEVALIADARRMKALWGFNMERKILADYIFLKIQQ